MVINVNNDCTVEINNMGAIVSKDEKGNITNRCYISPEEWTTVFNLLRYMKENDKTSVLLWEETKSARHYFSNLLKNDDLIEFKIF